jgi:secreted Zn-dependent insulinase-like peptidase
MYRRSKTQTNVYISTENLDELEEMVVPLFGNVENKDAKKLVYPFKFHPLGPEQLKHEIFIVPKSSSTQLLRVIFPIPDMSRYYKTNVSNNNVNDEMSSLSVKNC